MNIPRTKLWPTLLGSVLLTAATALAAPSITSPGTPQVIEVRDGLSATLTIEATSDTGEALGYQWFKGELPTPLTKNSKYAGTDTKTLKINALSADDSARYYAKVFEKGSLTVSDPSVDFNVDVLVRPKIKTQPVAPASVINQGGGLSFGVVLMEGTTLDGLTYQWQLNNKDIPLSANPTAQSATFVISAATAGNETTEGVQWTHAGSYRVMIKSVLPTSPKETVTTLFTKPVVVKVSSQPIIVTQPPAQLYVPFKGAGKLAVVAGGNPKLSYFWQKQGESGFADITKANASSYAVKEEGFYRVRVTNPITAVGSEGTISSTAEVIIINKPAEDSPITVASNKTANTKGEYEAADEEGQPPYVELTVHPKTDDVGTLLYQWQKDGKNIEDGTGVSGSLTATLRLDPLVWTHRGVYRCVVKNQVGVFTSKTFALKVNSKPIIITQPTSQLGVDGKAVTFSIVAGGNAPLTYKWFRDVVDGEDQEVGKAAKLTVSKLADASEGSYYCVVSNSYGSVTSDLVSLQVDKAVVISPTGGPSATPVEMGGTLTLSVSTSQGDGPISYQWQRNNVNLVNSPTVLGAVVTVSDEGSLRDSVLLQIQNVALSDAGNYRCIVSNVGGAVKVTSKTAKVTVLLPPAIAPGGDPTDVQAYEGGTATFKVVATGSPKLRYQWQRSAPDAPTGPFNDVVGQTSATLTLKNLTIDPLNLTAGFYRCEVRNDTSVAVQSAPALLTILPVPLAVVDSLTPNLAQVGEKIRLTGENFDFVDLKSVMVGFRSAPGAEPTLFKAAAVKESDTSLLLTMPGATVDTPLFILLKTAGGESETADPNLITRKSKQSNDRDNPTIVVGANFPSVKGTIEGPLDILDMPNGDVRGEAYYTWVFPKKGEYQLTLAAKFHAGMDTYVTRPSNALTTKTVGQAPFGAISYKIVVLEDMSPVKFVIYSSERFSGIIGFAGEYQMVIKFLSGVIPTTSPAGSTADEGAEAAAAVVAETSAAESWEVEGTSGLLKTGLGTSVLTGTFSSSGQPTVLWKDTSDLQYEDDSRIRTEWNMSIDQAGTGNDGYFAWQISGADGQPLGQVQFSVNSGAIYTVTPEGTRAEAEPVLVPGSEHRFEIITDLASDTWQVRMDGVALGSPLPLPENSGFGDVSAIWYPAGNGGTKPSMTFEDVTVTVD